MLRGIGVLGRLHDHVDYPGLYSDPKAGTKTEKRLADSVLDRVNKRLFQSCQHGHQSVQPFVQA